MSSIILRDVNNPQQLGSVKLTSWNTIEEKPLYSSHHWFGCRGDSGMNYFLFDRLRSLDTFLLKANFFHANDSSASPTSTGFGKPIPKKIKESPSIIHERKSPGQLHGLSRWSG